MENMNVGGNVVGYGAVEGVGDDSEELINSYYIIEGGLEQSIRTIKRRTRTKRQKNAMSLFDSYIFLVKGNVGSGILALPQAFSDAGYALSTVFIIFTGILAIHCMAILVDSVHFIVERWHLVSLEYGQTTEWAFLNLNSNTVNFGCCKVRKALLGQIGKIVVNSFLVITQLGFGIVYFVLMANTLNSVTKAVGFAPVNLRVWVIVLLVPIVALSWIREMKSLSPLIFIANLCILFVLLVIMSDIFQRLHAGSTAVQCIPPMVNGSVVPRDVCVGIAPGCGVVAVNTSPSAFNQVFLFFAIAVYAYEGIGVVLPLENKMKKPEYFKHILYSAMGTVMVMFLSLGLLGYLAYGECIQPNVTTNLVTDFLPLKILYLVAQLYVGYVIYVSFAQAFYVPMDFLEPPLLELLKLSDSSSLSNGSKVAKTAFHILFRSGIVTMLCGFALIEPSHLADVMSLVGAFASTSLALIFPPIIHILVFAFGQGGGASGLNRHLQSPTGIDNISQSSDENENAEDTESSDDDNGNSDEDSDSQPSSPLITKKKIVILKYWWVVKDVAIICFGLVCSVIGTYASFSNLIENFN